MNRGNTLRALGASTLPRRVQSPVMRGCLQESPDLSEAPIIKSPGRKIAWMYGLDGPHVLEERKMFKVVASAEQNESEILERAKNGCPQSRDHLIQAYGHYVRRLAARFFLPGAEREDLYQEGYSGLLFAIKTFSSQYGRTFTDYATMCIRNALLRAVRGATRKKALMLTQAGELKEGLPIKTSIGDPQASVTVIAISAYLKKNLPEKLSKLEFDALSRRAAGASVDEISEINHVTGKQVENALFRARQKARSLLQPWYPSESAASVRRAG